MLGDPRQVAQSLDVHLLEAVSAPHRKLVVGDRGLQHLAEAAGSVLLFRVVVHRQGGARILPEEPGLLVLRVGGQHFAIAVLGPVVFLIIFVEHAQVDQGADMNRRMVDAALVVGHGFLVIAGQVVGMAELEERSGVIGVNFHGPLQVANRLEPIPFPEEDAGELEVVLGAVGA